LSPQPTLKAASPFTTANGEGATWPQSVVKLRKSFGVDKEEIRYGGVSWHNTAKPKVQLWR